MSIARRRRTAIHPNLCLFLPFKPEQAQLMPLPHISATLLLYRLCLRQLLYFLLYPSSSYFHLIILSPASPHLDFFALVLSPLSLLLCFHLPLLPFTFLLSNCFLHCLFPPPVKKKTKNGGGGGNGVGGLDEKSVALSRGGHTPLR